MPPRIIASKTTATHVNFKNWLSAVLGLSLKASSGVLFFITPQRKNVSHYVASQGAALMSNYAHPATESISGRQGSVKKLISQPVGGYWSN
jgi:hypothetical protein